MAKGDVKKAQKASKVCTPFLHQTHTHATRNTQHATRNTYTQHTTYPTCTSPKKVQAQHNKAHTNTQAFAVFAIDEKKKNKKKKKKSNDNEKETDKGKRK